LQSGIVVPVAAGVAEEFVDGGRVVAGDYCARCVAVYFSQAAAKAVED